MAADNTNLTVIDALLKVMQGKLMDQINLSTPLLDVFTKRRKIRKTVGGARSVERPVRLRPNFSFAGVRGEDGAMARASRGSYDKMIVQIFPHNAMAKWGHIGEIKSEKDVQALQSTMKTAVKDLEDGFPIVLSQIWWGRGDGVVARVNGAPDVGALTFVVDEFNGAGGAADGSFGGLYLNPGGWYQATSDRTLTLENRTAIFQVISFDQATLTATVSGNIQDLANNDFISVLDGLGNVSDGILGVNEGYKDTYMNINRTVAANAWAKATRVVAVAAGNVEEKLMQGVLQVNKDIGGWPDFGLIGAIQFRRLFEVNNVDRRFVNTAPDKNFRKYALGFEAITMYSPGGKSIELFMDRWIPGDISTINEGIIVVLSPDDWEMVSAGTPGWYKDENGKMVQQVQGTYGKFCTWLDTHNLVCDVPKRQLFLEDINGA
jgi:hypothetical protein